MTTQAIEHDALDELLDRLEPFDALNALLFASCAGYRNACGEHVTGVPSVLVEYVWARLLRRDWIDGLVPRGEVSTEQLALQALSALRAELGDAMWQPGDGDPSGMQMSVRSRLAIQGIWAYDPAIIGLETRRTMDLLRPFAADVERATGATLASLVALTSALFRHSYEWLIASVGAHRPQPPASMEEAHERIRAAARQGAREQVLDGAGALAMTTPGRLATKANVPVDHAARFLDLLALPELHPQASLPFDRFVWELRRRPIARWGPLVTVPMPDYLLPALRPAIEQALRRGDTSAARRYDRARGKWLEARVTAQLQSLLPVDEGYRTLHVPMGDARRAERDALVCVDLCALAVEVKGVGIAPSARAGDATAQQRMVDRLVRNSARQATSLAAALRDGRPVTGVDLGDGVRRPLDLRGIQRWIPLVVTLEDVGGVAASSQAALGAVPTDGPVPLVLSMDDLAWYGRELPLPAALLHYLVVRARIARTTARLVVVDEADWFRLYLANGGARVQELLAAYADVPAQIFSYFSDARRGLPLGRTLVWRTPHEQLLRRWQAEAMPGWLEASFAMLDLSRAQSRLLAERLADARAGLVKDHDLALLTLRPTGDPQVALHVIGRSGCSGSIAMDELVPCFTAQAPDASLRVFLGTRDGVVDHLHFLGIGRFEPRQAELDESPSAPPS